MLLEVDRAITPVRHNDVAAFPRDLVVRVDTRSCVDAADLEAFGGFPASRDGGGGLCHCVKFLRGQACGRAGVRDLLALRFGAGR